jgi:hypothetical protein
MALYGSWKQLQTLTVDGALRTDFLFEWFCEQIRSKASQQAIIAGLIVLASKGFILKSHDSENKSLLDHVPKAASWERLEVFLIKSGVK